MKIATIPNVDLLTVSNLGPIDHLVVEPRPLTVLVGPQASGKSLVAQLLYFFRGLEGHTARWFGGEAIDSHDSTWRSSAVRATLDGLRGVPYGYFARGTARLGYTCSLPEVVDWEVSIYSSNRRVRLSEGLDESLNRWASKWERDPTTIARRIQEQNVFIPTERSLFTRLQAVSMQTLFDERQPEPFRTFADLLSRAGQRFDFYQKTLVAGTERGTNRRRLWFSDTVPQLLAFEREALSGEAYLPTHGPRQWKWRVLDSSGAAVTRGRDRQPVILPIEATSSGQSEAWPIFVVTAAYGFRTGVTFYIEEPETHLHPRAQVAIMRAVAYLLGKGCRFVVTTHSPFILYVLNNFLQSAHRYGNKVPKEKTAVKRELVAVYRLGVGRKGVDIIDPDTGLIQADELDDVANELGSEFEELL